MGVQMLNTRYAPESKMCPYVAQFLNAGYAPDSKMRPYVASVHFSPHLNWVAHGAIHLLTFCTKACCMHKLNTHIHIHNNYTIVYLHYKTFLRHQHLLVKILQ
jgi:hypothetical protein